MQLDTLDRAEIRLSDEPVVQAQWTQLGVSRDARMAGPSVTGSRSVAAIAQTRNVHAR